MSDELLLGIDLGTMSSKGVLCRPNGEVVATVERPHDVSMPRPGWVEHDAEEIWWEDFTAICSELLKGAEGTVAAVGLSGIGPCFLAAGKDGNPLTNYLKRDRRCRRRYHSRIQATLIKPR
jgi:xylulokinase